MKKILLSLLLLNFSISLAQEYTVNPIPYQVYTAPYPIQQTADDMYSPVVTLPFSFNFYGNNYSQIVISTNGYVDFRSNLAGTMSPWNIPQITIPNVNFLVKNSILGCYHDLYNATGSTGSITTATVGIAPYRKFIVFFNENGHYQCSTLKSSFQMVLYETFNFIDVQLIAKPTCSTWNGGRAVTGLINLDGTLGIAPPNRNTGSWTATQEGWRFKPTLTPSNDYNFTKCDSDTDGFETFNLEVVKNDLNPSNPSVVMLYETLTDAQMGTNQIVNLSYQNIIANTQTIFAVYNGQIKNIILKAIDCSLDYDTDTVPTALEDVNNDTNLAYDDTDTDGIPNYLDNEDDGDLVLTSVEYVFPSGRTAANITTNPLNTDNDALPNYLDNDDDGDGVLTIHEDYNHNNNPADDDTNTNGIADYLESAVALYSATFAPEKLATIYPNPVSSVLSIQSTIQPFSSIEIYTINGSLLKTIQTNTTTTSLDVSNLQSGMYLVKISFESGFETHKFIKE